MAGPSHGRTTATIFRLGQRLQGALPDNVSAPSGAATSEGAAALLERPDRSLYGAKCPIRPCVGPSLASGFRRVDPELAAALPSAALRDDGGSHG